MRSMLTQQLIFMATGAAAQAQLTPPSRRAPSRSRSQPFRSDPLCKPHRYRGRNGADRASGDPIGPRLGLANTMATISGDVQRAHGGSDQGSISEGRGGKPTGCSIPGAPGARRDPKRRQDNAGWKIITDAGTGARLGIPTKLVLSKNLRRQRRQMELYHRDYPDPAFAAQGSEPHHAKLAEREKKEPIGLTSTTPLSSRISSCCRIARPKEISTCEAPSRRLRFASSTVLYDQPLKIPVERW